MIRSIRTWAAMAVLILTAALGAVVFASPAVADTVGTLTFAPPAGSDVQVPKVHTSAACPTGSDSYYAYLTGPGAFAVPFLITAPQDVDFSTEHAFDVQLGWSIKDVATELGTTVVPGAYLVTVSCIDAFTQNVVGTFAGQMTFTSPTAYVSGGDGTSSPSPSSSGSGSPSHSASPSESPSPTDSVTPSDSATPTDPATPGPTDTGGGIPTTVPTPTSPAPSTSPVAAGLPITGPPIGGIVVIGLIFVLAGVAMVAGTGRRPEPVRW